jgi:hypothetical protein
MSIFGNVATTSPLDPAEELLARWFRHKESVDFVDQVINLVGCGILTGNEARAMLKLTPLPASVDDVLKTRLP